MAGQNRVVGLNIQFKVLIQPMLPQEADRRRGIKIILMLHGLFGLWLDEKVALKTDAPAVVHSHTHQPRDVFLFKPDVRVQQRVIALSAAPEHIPPAAQLHGQIEGFFDLCRRKAVDLCRVGAPCPVHVAGI